MEGTDLDHWVAAWRIVQENLPTSSICSEPPMIKD